MMQAKKTTTTPRKPAKNRKGGDDDSIVHLTFPAMQVEPPGSNDEWLSKSHRELVHIRLATVMLAEDDVAMTKRLMTAPPEIVGSMLEFAEAAMDWQRVLKSRAALHGEVAMRMAVVLERIEAARPEVSAALGAALEKIRAAPAKQVLT